MSERTPPTARQPADRVLIVPHCWDCGGSLALLLQLAGCHAEVVRSGDAAVRRALEVGPQAVLVDVHLAGDDPGEVVRRLRAALGSAVRLIGVASGECEGAPPGWAEAGLDGWLRKPVEADRLFDVLGLRRAGKRDNVH
jgi:DNA-binding response OmpR family regulator